MYFVSLAAWLSFRHAKLTAGGEGRVRILAIECVSFFLFFSLPTVLAFFLRSNAHTHTNKEGAKRRGKAEMSKGAVRFTRFVNYRLMFDSGCLFSLNKRGRRGQRRHAPYTPYSIGNSSRVIFRIGIKLPRAQRGCFVEVSHD